MQVVTPQPGTSVKKIIKNDVNQAVAVEEIGDTGYY